MNISKGEKHIRREKIKELFLTGTPTKDICNALGLSYQTVEKEINWIQEHYNKLALNHPQIVQAQFAKVTKLLEEVEIIKQEFWGIFKEIKQKDEDNKKLYEETKKKNEEETLQGVEEKNKTTIIVPKALWSSKINALKALLTRVEQEAKLLNLFNPKIDITNNITINDFKGVLVAVKDIIEAFVPPEKQEMAKNRLMNLKIKEEPIDTEIIDDRTE